MTRHENNKQSNKCSARNNNLLITSAVTGHLYSIALRLLFVERL